MNKTILLIDDEPQIRTLLTLMLEKEGFEITVAVDGSDGVEKFKETPTDLVITDIVMPEKEGIETIREIRKINQNVPIIAMSGGGINAPEGYLNIAKIIGANEALEKPVERNVLIKAVKKALNL